MGRRRATFENLMLRVQVNPETECWTWTGTIIDGYGSASALWPGGSRLVHRTVYEVLVGPIPDGLQLDHICHNGTGCPGGATCPHRACCNPAHLEPQPQKVNILRGEGPCAQHARKTHCKRGHEFTPENTGKASKGGRYCIICSREAARRQREKNHKGKRARSTYQPRPLN